MLPSTWGRVRGLLSRAHREPGLVIRVEAGVAELWWDERSGDRPYEEKPSGPVTVRVILAATTRFTVPGNYGDEAIDGKSEWATFEEAVAAARSTIRRFDYPVQPPEHRYSTSCVALRTEWRDAPQGVGLGTDTEVLRWTVTRSRVILQPEGRGLSSDQVQAAEALDNAGKKGWA